MGQRFFLVIVEDSVHPRLFLVWHSKAKIPGASGTGIFLGVGSPTASFLHVETFFFLINSNNTEWIHKKSQDVQQEIIIQEN